MFEAHLLKHSTLKKAIEAIKGFLTQATLHCDENGIQLQAMDKSQVYAVAMTLHAGGFDKYHCDKKISMGLNLISMSKILNCAADNDRLTLKADDKAETLMFIVESPNRIKVGEYEMQLIHLDLEQFDFPDMQYTCTIRMPSDQFSFICRQLSGFGNVFGITCTKDTVSFSALADTGSTDVELKQVGSKKGEHAVLVDTKEPFSQSYACPYLNYFSKVASLSPQVKLSMSLDLPLVVEYRIQKLWNIKYYLFPKMRDGIN